MAPIKFRYKLISVFNYAPKCNYITCHYVIIVYTDSKALKSNKN